jgi:predicted homoserine dehydrogenase-like protein
MLSRLKTLPSKIRVGIIGMGAMGKGLFYQCHVTPGIECVAVADIQIDRAVKGVEALNLDYRAVETLAGAHEAAHRGMVAICGDGEIVASCEHVDVLIEASSSIGAAGKYAIIALEHRKHLVLMNSEIDLIFGPFLMQLAKDNGVVYTSCGGDQHGVIKHLIDDLELWGFDLVMAGNIKGYLDRYANPTTIIPEANKRDLDYKMATSYTDGTKLNIEMALVANALGLSPVTPGMEGPRAAHVRDVFQLFDFRHILSRQQPVVDYVLNAEPDGGVFAVGYCENEYQRKMLSYYKMGEGPFYLFYRPYHLCHIEAMACVAEAFLDRQSLLQPTFGFMTNVFSYAKRELMKGEVLDGIGGYTCYGLIEVCPKMGRHEGLPICIAENVTLRRDVAKDEAILMADVEYDPNSLEFDLFSRAVGQAGKDTS